MNYKTFRGLQLSVQHKFLQDFFMMPVSNYLKGGKLLINEEVSRQVIAMVERGNIRTAKMVIDLMKKMLNMAAKKGKSLKEFINEKKPTTVKDLVKKGRVETLELNDLDFKGLKRELNKNGVKFSIKKDLTTGNNIIFFQAKDEKVMEQAFKEAVEKFAGKNKKRESVVGKLNHFKEVVKNAPKKDKIKEKLNEQSL